MTTFIALNDHIYNFFIEHIDILWPLFAELNKWKRKDFQS